MWIHLVFISIAASLAKYCLEEIIGLQLGLCNLRFASISAVFAVLSALLSSLWKAEQRECKNTKYICSLKRLNEKLCFYWVLFIFSQCPITQGLESKHALKTRYAVTANQLGEGKTSKQKETKRPKTSGSRPWFSHLFWPKDCASFFKLVMPCIWPIKLPLMIKKYLLCSSKL